jgi:hypothetical protein
LDRKIIREPRFAIWMSCNITQDIMDEWAALCSFYRKRTMVVLWAHGALGTVQVRGKGACTSRTKAHSHTDARAPLCIYTMPASAYVLMCQVQVRSYAPQLASGISHTGNSLICHSRVIKVPPLDPGEVTSYHTAITAAAFHAKANCQLPGALVGGWSLVVVNCHALADILADLTLRCLHMAGGVPCDNHGP